MRNLKKILALVLALIMSLSLMATAGAGSFQDVTDDNPYKTAIDVLDELKVFQGFEDGTFKPTDTLTRAQAAVLVYRIATGDVENKYLDNYTYMQQSKFTDLDGYNWAKGYINYCQNAGIVVGTDATHFNPGGQVTGYQLLVMLLRTLGYGKAGEFTDPKGWELQTAAIAEREGILKNVTGGDFEHAAPRQMVAEILFRGILHDTVEYSPLTPNGYTPSGEILGKRIGLEDIEGVVVANRIADLYDDEPMKDGQTRMIVDGKDYVIDMDTDATAIGLNHHAYVKDGKVLAGTLEAEGNVIGEPEHGEAAKVADLAKAAGIKTNADTDYYVNFDEVVSDTSNYRLEYLIGFEDMAEKDAYSLVFRNGGAAWIDTDGDYTFDRDTEKGFYYDKNGDLVSANGASSVGTTPADYLYDKVIPAKTTISSTDSRYMKEIFVWSDNRGGNTTSDDLFFGEVYVGTKSTLDKDDISDELSYDEFLDKYINANENRTITGSDNGEWLRVIDNNGDGVAEYVLRTDFIMTTVVDYEKRTDLYNVEYDVDGNGAVGNKPNAIISKIPADEIRKDEGVDMSVGAVILYTYIDGYYYVSNPEVQTLKVDTKSINAKKNTFTADGTDYTWSGIDEEAAKYYDDISEISYDVNYDMYLDHFGFVRLATEARRSFVLLTDAYFQTDNRNSEWKVELYDGEEKVETADVVDAARGNEDRVGRKTGLDGKIDGFIDTWEDDHLGNRGTWLRLNTFGEFYQQPTDKDGQAYKHYIDKKDTAGALDTKDPFYTNIALASETDGTWTLHDVTDLDTEYNGLYRNYNVFELAGTNGAFGTDKRIAERSLKAKNTDLWGISGNNFMSDGVLETSGWDDKAIFTAALQAIQTNGSTLYYLVENANSTTKRTVTSWVGYQNVPEDLGNFIPERAYAVTHNVGSTNDYQIADVVVFEGVYGAPVYDPQLIITGINTKYENALGKDSSEEGKYQEHRVGFELFERDELLAKAANEVNEEGLWTPQLNFYDSTYDNGNSPIAINSFNKYGIYAGKVVVADETKSNDYIEISATNINGKRISFYSDDVEAYEINRISRFSDEAAHNLEANVNDNIHMNDRLIVVCDKQDGVVKMVVNVSASGVDGKNLRDDGVKISKLVDLYNDIIEEETTDPADAEITVEYSNLPTGVTVGKEKVTKTGNDYTVEMPTVADGYTWKVVPADASEDNYDNFLKGDGNKWILTNVSGDITLKATLEHATDGTLTLTYDNNEISDLAVKFDDVAQTVKATDVAYDEQPVGTKVNVSFKLVAGQKSATLSGTTVELTKTDDVYSFELYLPTGATGITIATTANVQIPVEVNKTNGITGLNRSTTTGSAGKWDDLNGITLQTNEAGVTATPQTKKFVVTKIATVKADGTEIEAKTSGFTLDDSTGAITGLSGSYASAADVAKIVITAKVEAITASVTVVIGVDGNSKKVAKITNASAEAEGDTYPVALGGTLTLTIAPDEGNATDGRFAVTGGQYNAETGVITVGPVNGDVIVDIADATSRNLKLTTDANTKLTVTVDGTVKGTVAAGTSSEVTITVYPGQKVKLICEAVTSGYHAAATKEIAVTNEAGDIKQTNNAEANTGTNIKAKSTATYVTAVDATAHTITTASCTVEQLLADLEPATSDDISATPMSAKKVDDSAASGSDKVLSNFKVTVTSTSGASVNYTVTVTP